MLNLNNVKKRLILSKRMQKIYCKNLVTFQFSIYFIKVDRLTDGYNST